MAAAGLRPLPTRLGGHRGRISPFNRAGDRRRHAGARLVLAGRALQRARTHRSLSGHPTDNQRSVAQARPSRGHRRRTPSWAEELPETRLPSSSTLVRAGSARHREPLVLGGHKRSRTAHATIGGHAAFTATTLDIEAGWGRVRIPPPPAAAHQPLKTGVIGPAVPCRPRNPPSCAWFGQVGRSGIHAGDQGQRLHRGMSLAQTPPGLPLTRRLPRRGSLVGGSRRGSPCQPRSAMRSAAAPASGTCPVHVWATRRSAADRYAAVPSGTLIRRSLAPSWENRVSEER